jgi:hypothetical protein
MPPSASHAALLVPLQDACTSHCNTNPISPSLLATSACRIQGLPASRACPHPGFARIQGLPASRVCPHPGLARIQGLPASRVCPQSGLARNQGLLASRACPQSGLARIQGLLASRACSQPCQIAEGERGLVRAVFRSAPRPEGEDANEEPSAGGRRTAGPPAWRRVRPNESTLPLPHDQGTTLGAPVLGPLEPPERVHAPPPPDQWATLRAPVRSPREPPERAHACAQRAAACVAMVQACSLCRARSTRPSMRSCDCSSLATSASSGARARSIPHCESKSSA